jgi:hypothetical protein
VHFSVITNLPGRLEAITLRRRSSASNRARKDGGRYVAGKTTYIQCKETGKFIEKPVFYANHSASVHTLEEFVSPIDQSIIRTPSDLAKHNKKHGVTDQRDYSPAFLEKATKERMAGFNEQGRKDRVGDLNRAYEKQRELER